MRILIIGGGGREHALAWALSRSSHKPHLFAAPGNPGIASLADLVPLSTLDLDALASFAERELVDLTVVGPEAPLIAGIVDRFEARGLRIFGPSADPAKLEGSKAFAKRLMEDANIPTAAFRICETAAEAHEAAAGHFGENPGSTGLVVKADGLAAGKGVLVTDTEQQAHEAVSRMMESRDFGDSGMRVILEERLAGEEASLMAVSDGETVLPLLPAQDHKRLLENDDGPNTGGMGAYSPVPIMPPALVDEAMDTVVRPAIRAIAEYGIPYKGLLYAGLMLTSDGIKAIEFNCRFGDPEAQTVLPLMESDLVDLLLGAAECRMPSSLKWRAGTSVCVVAASAGYPGAVRTGIPISGIADAAESEGCLVFEAGTRYGSDGRIETSGGRVLSVTGLGADLITATARAYVGMSHIQFDGLQYRRDIAGRALRAPATGE
ncbi:MAG: phosphoribosylamine--glycine ligase [Armatimonadetes bacterium]|nr:phosphoribosylamine--glycine ligase [Armatimonadota bacterium]MDE2205865.1 phosphoribosylamine--glycine ligase [Armatimonadota bacterium]